MCARRAFDIYRSFLYFKYISFYYTPSSLPNRSPLRFVRLTPEIFQNRLASPLFIQNNGGGGMSAPRVQYITYGL